VGLPEPQPEALAKQKAAAIELDVSAGYFDPTLLKYKPRTLALGKLISVSYPVTEIGKG
jgi:hypothetical protein